jgi:ProP effector
VTAGQGDEPTQRATAKRCSARGPAREIPRWEPRMKPLDLDAIAKANQTIDVLCARFPRAFFRDGAKRRPLKIEIHFDLAKALDGAIPSLDLRAALKLYTASPRYRHALTVGAARIDLDGDPVGEVSAVHAAHAAFASRRFRKRKPKPPTPKSAPTAAPRPSPDDSLRSRQAAPARDGLAALKAAPALRRQQQQQRDR